MPIGKDSITKRVAKATTEEKIAPELVATTAAAPTAKKAPAKKPPSASSNAKKTTSTSKKATTKKSSSKTKTVTETLTPPIVADEKIVETAVLANVSPETVAAVIGHEEDEKYAKVQLGQKLPDFLL